METTVEILNKIANKLGDENADQYTTVAQALGSIANALGNSDPDKIQTVPEALQEILAVAGGGGGTPKAFGVDLLQISVPYAQYDLTNFEIAEGVTIHACALPWLDQYASDVSNVADEFGAGVCGTGMSIDGESNIYVEAIHVASQLGVTMLTTEADFIFWKDGKAYYGTDPQYDTIEIGWEFFVLKSKPTVETDGGGDGGDEGE